MWPTADLNPRAMDSTAWYGVADKKFLKIHMVTLIISILFSDSEGNFSLINYQILSYSLGMSSQTKKVNSKTNVLGEVFLEEIRSH